MDSPRQTRETLAQSLVVGLPGPSATDADLELVAGAGLGGVILFSRNYESPEQLWRLCHDLGQAARSAGRPPLFIMVDQEGGSVARLKAPFTDGPDLRDLGQAPPSRLADHGRRLGRELLAAGCNFNLAPVLDVHAIEGGVMARRSLGGDPGRVAELGLAFIAGLQESGCLACAKHFPGLGRTTLDTHRQRPRVELSRPELEAMELVPFRAAASAVAGIMICHAVFAALDPQRPASLSPGVIEDLLREEMDFDGLVLSDDLEMGALAADLSPAQAAVASYGAGCDLLLICHRQQEALAALETLVSLAQAGDIPPERLAASARRLARAKAGLPPMPDSPQALLDLLRQG